MFETILYPTDFSDISAAPLFCLPAIPGIRKIVLQHVLDDPSVSRDTPYDDPLAVNARIMLDLMAQHVREQGLETEVFIDVPKEGTAGDAILDRAGRAGASMIVMGARGKGETETALGSVSADVLQRSALPLLLLKFPALHGPGRDTFEKYCYRLFARVLVPTDFSPHAQATITALAGFPHAGALILFHVVDDRSSINTPGIMTAAASRLGRIQEDLIRRGIPAMSRVCFGKPAREIIAMAEEEDVSLIVMNPLGEGILQQLREFFLGSTTAEVAWLAERPVLVLRI